MRHREGEQSGNAGVCPQRREEPRDDAGGTAGIEGPGRPLRKPLPEPDRELRDLTGGSGDRPHSFTHLRLIPWEATLKRCL